MRIEPEVRFHDMRVEPEISRRIRTRVRKLEQFHGNITRCRVTVERHPHARRTGPYRVRLDLTVPGR